MNSVNYNQTDKLIVQYAQKNAAPTTVLIMGATATGKTELAIALKNSLLAKKTLDLISVDSALVYRGLTIGTAKPEADVLQQAPHQLIDIIEPTQTYSAGQFRTDALNLMQKSTEKKHIPVLVGGTMLYFNALQKGIANMPNVSQVIKKQVAEQEKTQGLTFLHQQLTKIDPVSASKIHPNDSQRTKRALEIFYATGSPLSEYWANQPKNAEFPYHRIKIALFPNDRKKLRERITERFEKMLKQGFIEEVEALYKQIDLNGEHPSMRAVGYRQVWQYLDGQLNFEQMREKTIIATAQLAKRQMTWLRKEEFCNFFDPESLNTARLLKNLNNLLL